MKTIRIFSLINTDTEFLYNLFLDSKLHTKITGSKAKIVNKVGGKFTAWDGYISGKIIFLEKNKKIVQTWRTTEFKPEDKDSILEITMTKISKSKSKLTLKQNNLPEELRKNIRMAGKNFI